MRRPETHKETHQAETEARINFSAIAHVRPLNLHSHPIYVHHEILIQIHSTSGLPAQTTAK